VKRAPTAHELFTIARSKGWSQKGSAITTKEMIAAWLAERGVATAEIFDTVEQMRAAARGGRVGAAATTPGVTRSEVEGIVADVVHAQLQRVPATDEATIAKLVAEAVARAQPARIVLDGVDAKPVKFEARTHPLFEKVLRLVRAGLNVLLVGPAGCGKTTLAQHVAKALKRQYGTLHCTAGASESQLTGWLLPIGAGKNPNAFTYVASEFVRLYEQGDSVFLLDEIDAADPNMMLIINGALANGALHVQQRHENPHVARGKNVAIMAAANTYGTGADSMYAGRNQLDAATLDRFYVVELDYDAALEASLVGDAAPAPTWKPASQPDAVELKAIGRWVADMRTQVKTHRLRRVVSTRTIQKAVAARVAGVPLPEVKRDLLAGWTKDELAKVGA
jgi:MoxR-like ATPase